MSKPANYIKEIKLPSNTTYEIIPERLGDANYVAELPTLNSDSTLALDSDIGVLNLTQTEYETLNSAVASVVKNRVYRYQDNLYKVSNYNVSTQANVSSTSILNSSGQVVTATQANTGQSSNLDRFKVTDYLPVNPNWNENNFGNVNTQNTPLYVCYYNSSKTFISGFTYDNTSAGTRISGALGDGNYGGGTIPSNASYVRFSFNVGGANTYMTYSTGALRRMNNTDYIVVRQSADKDLTQNSYYNLDKFTLVENVGNSFALSGTNRIEITGKVNAIRVTSVMNFYQYSTYTTFSNEMMLDYGALQSGLGFSSEYSNTPTAGRNLIMTYTLQVGQNDRIRIRVRSTGDGGVTTTKDKLKANGTYIIVEVVE